MIIVIEPIFIKSSLLILQQKAEGKLFDTSTSFALFFFFAYQMLREHFY